jgi:hypothetical protein
MTTAYLWSVAQVFGPDSGFTYALSISVPMACSLKAPQQSCGNSYNAALSNWLGEEISAYLCGQHSIVSTNFDSQRLV